MIRARRGRVSGWGNWPRRRSLILSPSGEAAVEDLFLRSVAADAPAMNIATRIQSGHIEALLPRGLGRSYGDGALGPVLLETGGLNRLKSFDEERGIVEAEAGLSLDELVRRVLPRGWLPPVIPGTRWVSLGGAAAADIHGKSHHQRGNFSAQVLGMRLLTPAGRIVDCSPEVEGRLFRATFGGMGLTGLILSLRLRLLRVPGVWFRRWVIACPDLERTLGRLADSGASHTVAWLDASAEGPELGRGLVYLGEPSSEGPADDRRGSPAKRNEGEGAALQGPFHRPPLLGPPFTPPFPLIGTTALRGFNRAVWRLGRRREGREHFQHYSHFFWPLDRLAHWNRLYGSRGFLQFQCVLPGEAGDGYGEGPLRRILKEVRSACAGAGLVVLKLLGAPGAQAGPLAFPMAGPTLALDLPRRAGSVELIRRLNRLTADAGGRVYLAKDALLDPALFREMYPAQAGFLELKREIDPQNRLAGDLARRLELVP